VALAVSSLDVTALSQFSAQARHVEVYATVTDEQGRPVTGLAKDDFIVAEDGMAQVVTVFEAGAFPLALAIGIDRSFSLSPDELKRAIDGARQLLEALGPMDRATVLAIGSTVETLAPLSADRGPALAALARLDRWGSTPLYDAALQGIDAIQAATGRRALVLITDGADRYSSTTAGALVLAAKRRDVLVYPIALGRERPPVLVELAGATGGRSFAAHDDRAMTLAVRGVADELRQQYLLGYTPARSDPAEQEWRSIRVSVKRSNVRVRARDGYFTRGPAAATPGGAPAY
jgi:Ca-activated chloride channel homolog